MKTYKLAKNICPTCNNKLDAATSAENDDTREPESGDITICLYCATILEFADEGNLITTDMSHLPAEQKAEILGMQTLMKMNASGFSN